MTNLIIGCGYLGSRVATLWLQEGHRVLATTRRPETAQEFTRQGIEPVLCDVLAPDALRSLPPLDNVLYAVGFDRSSGRAMREVYVEGLARVLNNLVACQRFIHVSSSSVYGQSDGGWVDEDSPTEPQEESGRIVLAAEQTLRQQRPDALLLRFSGIYGPGRLLRQKSIQTGEPIVGDADKWLNLIHVADGARMILAAAMLPPAGLILNVCDDQPVPRRAFYTELARLLHAPSPRFVPPPPDQPTPPHEKGNRRIRNERMKSLLKTPFLFPSYREGLAASMP